MVTTVKLDAKAIVAEAFAAAQKASAESYAKIGEREACGFAWVDIKPARGAVVQALKGMNAGHVKSWGGGEYQVWMPGRQSTQSISVHEAGAYAFAEVLRKYGLDAWAGSRRD